MPLTIPWASLTGALLLMSIHLFVGHIKFFEREWARSFGAGIAISYVFLDVLPHLATYQSRILAAEIVTSYLYHHVYVLALAGFAIFFGLAGLTQSVRHREGSARASSRREFWVLVFALALYNLVIGFLIGEQPDHRYEPVIIFAIAMAMHTAGVDRSLLEMAPRAYDKIVRYGFAAATLTGWMLGVTTTVPAPVFAIIFAFVIGVIIVVAFIHELPYVASSHRYAFFLAGVLSFSLLLLFYEAAIDRSLGA